MKCPCCGKDMFMDSHTKIDKYMCYDCGYMEGRRIPEHISAKKVTNFERIGKLNYNGVASLIASGFGVDKVAIASWLEQPVA